MATEEVSKQVSDLSFTVYYTSLTRWHTKSLQQLCDLSFAVYSHPLQDDTKKSKGSEP